MSSITIFSGAFCHGGEVARKMAQSLGSELLFDGALISQTSGRFQMSESKIHRALFEKPSVFNKFTHEKERAIANLKLLLAEILKALVWELRDSQPGFRLSTMSASLP